MACRDEGRAAQEAQNQIQKMQAALDGVTRMLCGVLDAIETAEEPVTLDYLSRETQEWWRAHKAADAKRRAAEEASRKRMQDEVAARARAFAKLTPEERAALGLK